MWTEILTEDIGVTHVNGHHVVFGLSDNVEEYQVRAAKEALEWREMFKFQQSQLEQLTKEMEKQQRMMDVLKDAGYDESLMYEPTNTTW
jgi:ferredoxin-fold anticodon binding domain-containing protein